MRGHKARRASRDRVPSRGQARPCDGRSATSGRIQNGSPLVPAPKPCSVLEMMLSNMSLSKEPFQMNGRMGGNPLDTQASKVRALLPAHTLGLPRMRALGLHTHAYAHSHARRPPTHAHPLLPIAPVGVCTIHFLCATLLPQAWLCAPCAPDKCLHINGFPTDCKF